MKKYKSALLLILTSIWLVSPVCASWTTMTIDSDGRVGECASIALDSSGNPHISYGDRTNEKLKYAYFDGSNWHTEVVDVSGWHTSIAIDSNDRPHICYKESWSVDSNLKYAYYDGSAWQIETIGKIQWGISIALDSNDNPHVSYSLADNLTYTYFDGSNWHTETVAAKGESYVSIAIDINDNPHIGYWHNDYPNSRSLNYAYHDGSSWHIEVVDANGMTGYNPSIALNSSDKPCISYLNADNDDLLYAYYDGTNWQREVVDSAGNVGVWCSLAIDNSDNPHISYLNPSNDDLKHAYYDGSNWQREVVDGGIDTYSSTGHTSIAIDSDNNLHIAYHDLSSDDLKYATTADITPTTTTTTTAPVDDCINFNLIEGYAQKPSKVYLFFSITDCDGNPKANLFDEGEFEIYENNDYISKYESSQTILPSPKLYTMSTVLLLDTSGSILASETLASLKSSAELFIDSVAGNQEVGIYLFDGRENLKELVAFTKDTTTLNDAISSLTKEDITGDPDYDNSTNLNGAVIKGLSKLNVRQSRLAEEQLFTGTMVVFTDGTDQASRVSDGDAVNAVTASSHSAFTIGLGGEIDETHLTDLGKDGFVWAANVVDLENAFIEIANKIESESKKYYVLGYCSPKRAGNHSVTLKLTGYEGSFTFDFNANNFTPGCNVSEIMKIIEEGFGDKEFQIAGNVLGNDGIYVKGLSGIEVTLYDDEGGVSNATTDAEGDFIFDRLKAQTYIVLIESNTRGFTPEKYELNLKASVDGINFEEETTACALVTMYGEDSDEVALLRQFRDEVLSRADTGKELIKLYYEWSPVIVNAITVDEELKSEIKVVVDGMVVLIGVTQ